MIRSKPSSTVRRRLLGPRAAIVLAVAMVPLYVPGNRAADARLDPLFGVAGIASITGGGRAALHTDGRIVVAGQRLSRYHVDGSIDLGFRTQSVDASAIVVQPNQSIVVAGGVLARFDPYGFADTSFGTSGSVALAWPARDLGLTANGKLVVVGSVTRATADIVLARYNPDGSIDSTFGNAGTVVTDTGRQESANAIKIQPDGKILGFTPSGVLR